ncbi:MAG TPA: hypothetical protein VGC77_12395 [Rhodopseudomonas sp.]|uniref:hypothetical protein n=1 Tax=Rhodopseudomonas sp. TaxID=1078 RepID=UPI002EDB05E9
MRRRVYCSGSIQKGPADTKKLCWSDTERAQVNHGARPVEIDFLNPDDPVTNLDDHLPLFGRDMFQIQQCDVVIIDARERRGIGIGVELLAGRHFSRAVIGVLPPSSYYRQSNVEYRGGVAKNYVHPHFMSLLDAVVDDFTSAGRWIRDELPTFQPRISDSVLEEAIAAYRERLLPNDLPMRLLFPN